MAADYGATSADIQARIPTVTFTASSQPTTTAIGAWIEDAEARLNNALKAGGITTPVTNAEGIEQLKSLSIDYAEGRTRRALAVPGSEGDSDGQRMLDAFQAVVDDIRANPGVWGAMLGGGDAEENTQKLRSHITHDVDGRSSSHTDFEPRFTKAALEEQF